MSIVKLFDVARKIFSIANMIFLFSFGFSLWFLFIQVVLENLVFCGKSIANCIENRNFTIEFVGFLFSYHHQF